MVLLLEDASFWISVITIVGGLSALCIKTILKSKCTDFSLCFGLVKISRNVEMEVKEH